MKEARAEQRRRVIEEKRKKDVEALRERIRTREERIQEEQEQRRKEHEEAAREKNEDREKKLSTVRAAEECMKEVRNLILTSETYRSGSKIRTCLVAIGKRKCHLFGYHHLK